MGQKFAHTDADGFVVAFYTELNDRQQIPPTAIAITDEAHTMLLAGQSTRRMRVMPDGTPHLVDHPPPTQEELIASTTARRDMLLRAAAERIATLQDAVDLDMATVAERAALTAWRQYRVHLSRVDVTNPEWPEAPAN
ncbi:tail fiber assembly protein [Cupriavidus metallidurans]|uniref:tail fiber assembly protein n=1 Tax=Cupriavidus metallidurans TaxID=119219 RepID=UPI001CC8F0A7|nr:tail fiber assembly protein [Cupriavidus metallidurans]UBM11726.1 tail fiber assembly protein [Cupriavidus metallidurans]